jgi:hypothetical protein
MLETFCNHYEKINNKYITCQKILVNNNFYCDEHIKESVKINSEYKNFCIYKVKKLLHDHELVFGELNKAKTSVNIFKFLSKHLAFVWTHKKFRKTVKEKIIEFKNKNFSDKIQKILKLDEYKMKIFKPNLYCKAKEKKIILKPIIITI